MRRSRKERALVEQAARQLTVDPADQSGQGDAEIAEEVGEPFPSFRLRRKRIR